MLNHHFVDIANMIKECAPVLSTTFLGPYAGIALSLVSKAIGASSNPQAVKDALSADSGSWLDKIKGLEESHGNWLAMLGAMKPPSKISINLCVEFPES